MIKRKPIAETALRARVAQGEARMNPSQLRLWEAIRFEPQKWQQHPYGDPGAGFWVVALVGRTVIWYNDIEDGFNRSRYSAYGTIDDYWCNQGELELTVQYLMNVLEQGADLVRLVRDSLETDSPGANTRLKDGRPVFSYPIAVLACSKRQVAE